MRRLSPLLVLWLVAVWLMLWRSVEPFVVLSGILVVAGVLALFPLRPVRSRLFARPIRVLWLAAYLGQNLVTSGLRVAWDAARDGPRAKALIVEVPILADTDFVVASAANMLSLGPGRFVLQIDRAARRFYVYVLVGRCADPDAERADAIAMQVRVARAFGTREEVRAVLSRAERLRGPEMTAVKEEQ